MAMSDSNEQEPRYPFLAIDVPVELAEAAATQLFELGAEGVEQRDAFTMTRGALSPEPPKDFGYDVGAPVDEGWGGSDREPSPGETVTLVAAFATEEEAQDALEAFDAELNPRLEIVVGDAWRDAWKAHFEPFRLSKRVVIKPPWREVPQALIDEVPGTMVLELEPGRAFGTGLHATTSLVAQALDARAAELAGKDVLDVGCGSGILALVALMFGAARARGLDIDEAATNVANENAQRTGMADRFSADASDVGALDGTWPIVLANIQAEVLIALRPAIAARVAEGGLLVLSGVLEMHEEAVKHAYADFTLEEATRRAEWVCLVLRAKA
jgi:ribosomal protein L11 methyltransferase